MRRGRKPRSDELDLWKQAARNVSPLHKRKKETDEPDHGPGRSLPREFTRMELPQIRGGKSKLKNDIAPSLTDRLGSEPVRMDQKAYRQLRRGRVKPDARIDLHGMTLDVAHASLVRFVMTRHAAGKRLLLVITGKGKSRDDDGPIPVRYGVLRHQVPEWLRLPPLSGLVLQVTQAHPSHGGTGAYYVYLRKAR